MNILGTPTGVAAEIYPGFDRWFRLRIAYLPSRAFLKNGARTRYDFVNDYTGTVYYFDFLFPPPVPLITGINWSTSGYSPGEEIKERYLSVHIGLNISRIISMIRKTDTLFIKIIRQIDKYYVLPLTLVEFRYGLNHGKFETGAGLTSYFICHF